MEELKELYRIVEERMGISEEQIKSNIKPTEIVDARRVVAIVLSKNTGMNLEKIGHAIGRDHSTVCHYKKTTDGLIETDKRFRINFNHVNARFKIATDGRTLEEKLRDLLNTKEVIEQEIVVINEEIRKYSNEKTELCV